MAMTLDKAATDTPSSDAVEAEAKKGAKRDSVIKELKAQLKAQKSLTLHHQKSHELLTRTHEKTKSDYTKILLSNERLENLCRALQKESKETREKSVRLLKLEEDKWKDKMSSVHNSMSSIKEQIDSNSQHNIDLQKKNIELSEQLSSIVTHYESKEKMVNLIMEKRDASENLMKLQLQKLKEEHTCEQKRLNAVLAQVALTEKAKDQEINELKANITALRSGLKMISTQMEVSRKASRGCRAQLVDWKSELTETMTGYTKNVRTETIFWHQQYEKATDIAQQLMHDRQALVTRVNKQDTKISTLESLCRSMQVERKALYQLCEEKNVDVGELPKPQENTSPPSSETAPVEQVILTANEIQEILKPKPIIMDENEVNASDLKIVPPKKSASSNGSAAGNKKKRNAPNSGNKNVRKFNPEAEAKDAAGPLLAKVDNHLDIYDTLLRFSTEADEYVVKLLSDTDPVKFEKDHPPIPTATVQTTTKLTSRENSTGSGDAPANSNSRKTRKKKHSQQQQQQKEPQKEPQGVTFAEPEKTVTAKEPAEPLLEEKQDAKVETEPDTTAEQDSKIEHLESQLDAKCVVTKEESVSDDEGPPPLNGDEVDDDDDDDCSDMPALETQN